MSRITRDDLDEVLRLYGNLPRSEVPERYRNPENERDFQLGIALALKDIAPNSGPLYDDSGNLTGWKGIRLKK